MIQERKKSIFYFEDDFEGVKDVVGALREDHYDVTFGAQKDLIEITRELPIDLVIIDLMIHRYSDDENGKEVANIRFDGIEWDRTGVEFLRKIRNGDYEKFGFPKDIPVVIVSAVVDYDVQKEIGDHEVKVISYFEKPVTIEEISNALKEVFSI